MKVVGPDSGLRVPQFTGAREPCGPAPVTEVGGLSPAYLSAESIREGAEIRRVVQEVEDQQRHFHVR